MICDECKINEAMHWSSRCGVESNLCCICHIKHGNAPANWHSSCVSAYLASKSFTPQKFHKGDLVRVTKNLGSLMSNFESNCDAIVIGSYADQYPEFSKTNTNDYTIFIKDYGTISWYHSDQLTLIETGRFDLLAQWESEREIKDIDQHKNRLQ